MDWTCYALRNADERGTTLLDILVEEPINYVVKELEDTRQ